MFTTKGKVLVNRKAWTKVTLDVEHYFANPSAWDDKHKTFNGSIDCVKVARDAIFSLKEDFNFISSPEEKIEIDRATLLELHVALNHFADTNSWCINHKQFMERIDPVLLGQKTLQLMKRYS